MTQKAHALDRWIRNDFKAMNTELEEIYFTSRDSNEPLGDSIKTQLVDEGRALIAELLNEGNTDEGFDSGFELLGDVGFYMAACRRHDITRWQHICDLGDAIQFEQYQQNYSHDSPTACKCFTKRA